MFVYLKIEVPHNCESYVAYYVVSASPSYVWRYTNYAEGVNYYRTHARRGQVQQNMESFNLAIL